MSENDSPQDGAPFGKVVPDAYTNAVLTRLGAEVFSGFTREQQQALIDSISACSPVETHSVDIRATIPLFFLRLYVVILMGRDRRHSTRTLEQERRQTTGHLADVVVSSFFWFTAVLLLSAILFATLYLLKVFLGIDIYPDEHLSDFLNR